MTQYIGRL